MFTALLGREPGAHFIPIPAFGLDVLVIVDVLVPQDTQAKAVMSLRKPRAILPPPPMAYPVNPVPSAPPMAEVVNPGAEAVAALRHALHDAKDEIHLELRRALARIEKVDKETIADKMKETAKRTADENIERMDEDYENKMRNMKSQIEPF